MLKRLAPLAWLALSAAVCAADPRIDWDGDPMAALRPLLRQAPPAPHAPDARLDPAESPNLMQGQTLHQVARVRTVRRVSPAPDPRAGREFRQVRPLIPIGPACPDGSDPPCAVERPYPPGSPPRGGYYYGFYRGPGGKLVYGKLYLPHYGPFDGQAHNDPPEKVRGQTPNLFFPPDSE